MKDDSINLSKEHGVNPSMSICAWCGETKEIVLFGKLKNDEEAPRQAVFNLDPCDDCKKQMDKGITLAESLDGKTPTGRWVVVLEDKVHLLIKDEEILKETLEKRMCFVDKEIMDMILKRG